MQPDVFVDQPVASLLQGVEQADDVCVLAVFPDTFAIRHAGTAMRAAERQDSVR